MQMLSLLLFTDESSALFSGLELLTMLLAYDPCIVSCLHHRDINTVVCAPHYTECL